MKMADSHLRDDLYNIYLNKLHILDQLPQNVIKDAHFLLQILEANEMIFHKTFHRLFHLDKMMLLTVDKTEQ